MTYARRQGGTVRNRLISALSEVELQRLEPFLEEVELPAKLPLCTVGDSITHAVFPHDAVTSMLVDLAEGQCIELGLIGAEGVVGLDLLYGARESVTTVIVQMPGHGIRIRADAFQREILAKNGDFYGLLLRYGRAFFGMVAQSGACNATHPMEQRLARWLLMMYDRVQRERFPLTHEFIALMLGVRRASVSEAANGLRVVGAIDYDRGEMRVLRRDLLEQRACGCYAVIRRLSDSVFAA